MIHTRQMASTHAGLIPRLIADVRRQHERGMPVHRIAYWLREQTSHIRTPRMWSVECDRLRMDFYTAFKTTHDILGIPMSIWGEQHEES